jgi:TonB family protein
MRIVVFLCLVVMPIDAQQPNSQSDWSKGREVHLHLPAGTKIGPNDKVTPAKLIKRVNPAYPSLARQTRISGTVRFHVTISAEGNVQELEVLSGHPLLVQSAMDAVRQWKYEPTLLNDKPVEVDTTIDVIFSLDLGSGESRASPSMPTQSATKIDAKLHDDIKHMLGILHATERSEAVGRQMFESMRPMLQASLPNTPNRDKVIESYENKLASLFRTEEFQEGTIATYAKYFNDDDILQMTKFYETPTGQKFNDNMAAFSSDLMRIGQTLARERIPGMFLELCKEYPELDGKLPNCSAADENKKSEFVPPQTGTFSRATH